MGWLFCVLRGLAGLCLGRGDDHPTGRRHRRVRGGLSCGGRLRFRRRAPSGPNAHRLDAHGRLGLRLGRRRGCLVLLRIAGWPAGAVPVLCGSWVSAGRAVGDCRRSLLPVRALQSHVPGPHHPRWAADHRILARHQLVHGPRRRVPLGLRRPYGTADRTRLSGRRRGDRDDAGYPGGPRPAEHAAAALPARRRIARQPAGGQRLCLPHHGQSVRRRERDRCGLGGRLPADRHRCLAGRLDTGIARGAVGSARSGRSAAALPFRGRSRGGGGHR